MFLPLRGTVVPVTSKDPATPVLAVITENRKETSFLQEICLFFEILFPPPAFAGRELRTQFLRFHALSFPLSLFPLFLSFSLFSPFILATHKQSSGHETGCLETCSRVVFCYKRRREENERALEVGKGRRECDERVCCVIRTESL